MDLKTLKPFCAMHGRMEYPWSVGEHTYASNGFVVVRVPRMPEVAENPDTPNVLNLYKQDNPCPVDGWVGLANLPELEPCPACKGIETTIKCPECEGDGVVDFENDHSEYECDCKTCDGSGEIGGCSTCGNTGLKNKGEELDIAGGRYRIAYLQDFSKLPNAQISQALKDGKPTWLRFDGGDGLVQPMRTATLR